jgi:hypothetical protein
MFPCHEAFVMMYNSVVHCLFSAHAALAAGSAGAAESAAAGGRVARHLRTTAWRRLLQGTPSASAMQQSVLISDHRSITAAYAAA